MLLDGCLVVDGGCGRTIRKVGKREGFYSVLVGEGVDERVLRHVGVKRCGRGLVEVAHEKLNFQHNHGYFWALYSTGRVPLPVLVKYVAICVRVGRQCYQSGGTDVVDLPDILLPEDQFGWLRTGAPFEGP